jgi:branched-chain amino acid transport system substrate-binding protein
MSLRLKNRILALAYSALFALMANACATPPNPDSDDRPYRVGMVLALSGTGSVFADAARQGAELGIDHLNTTNAAGRPFSMIIVDDATDPRTAADVCNRLVTQEKVDAIVGCESTPARLACNQAAGRAGIPYIAASASGGDICLPNLFQVGIVPSQQVDALVDYLIKEGAKSFYLFGSDYSSPKASFDRAKSYVESRGGTIAGTSYEPLGTSDFSADIAKIAAANPDVVLDAIVGSDGIAFIKQFKSDPRTAKIKLASLEMKASTARAIGPPVEGTIVPSDYFPSIQSPANDAFLAAMRQKFGDAAQPSESAVLTYDAMNLLAAAVREANSTEGQKVIQSLARISFDGPRGRISFDNGTHYATLTIFVGIVASDGSFHIQSVSPPLVPQLNCNDR